MIDPNDPQHAEFDAAMREFLTILGVLLIALALVILTGKILAFAGHLAMALV